MSALSFGLRDSVVMTLHLRHSCNMRFSRVPPPLFTLYSGSIKGYELVTRGNISYCTKKCKHDSAIYPNKFRRRSEPASFNSHKADRRTAALAFRAPHRPHGPGSLSPSPWSRSPRGSHPADASRSPARRLAASPRCGTGRCGRFSGSRCPARHRQAGATRPLPRRRNCR